MGGGGGCSDYHMYVAGAHEKKVGNHCRKSYNERGSKTAIVTVLQPKTAYGHFLTVPEIQHDHHTVCLLLQPMFTGQPIKMQHEISATWR